jgi:DNA-binding GntR family transcriptional regulator
VKHATADVEGEALERSRLQRELTERMIELFRSQELAPGDRLTELSLARQLKVRGPPSARLSKCWPAREL